MSGEVVVRGGVRDSPPGIMRSAPPMRTGMTGAGVVRIGSRFGRFQRVYTEGGSELAGERV